MEKYRRLGVRLYGRAAGTLEKRFAPLNGNAEPVYRFSYLPEYLADPESQAIGYVFPLSSVSFDSPGNLHPFFENLLSEGWNLRMQSRAQRIDESDAFSLLANNGADLVGAVTVHEPENAL